MHGKGILHRDIQLGNCTIGLPPNHQTIYMIDFGFSKRYIDPNTNRHIPDSKAKRDFIGNYWFSSVGVHCRGRGEYIFLLELASAVPRTNNKLLLLNLNSPFPPRRPGSSCSDAHPPSHARWPFMDPEWSS